MKIYLTRDSVHPGDDYNAPHAHTFPISSDWDFDNLVSSAVKAAKLPNIVGGKATWVLSSNIPIAVHAQEWNKPKLIWKATLDQGALDILNNEIRMHWSYFAQIAPDTVLEVMDRLRLRAIDDGN
jgi:hypothetical protein